MEKWAAMLYVAVGGWEAPPCVLVPPVVWYPPAPPLRCCAPLWWVLAPCAGAPPRCCGPDPDHCYDRREATALDAFIRSLHGDTTGAATHTPTGRVSGGLGGRTPSSTAAAGVQSAERSGAAASHSRSHCDYGLGLTPNPVWSLCSLCLLWLELVLPCGRVAVALLRLTVRLPCGDVDSVGSLWIG